MARLLPARHRRAGLGLLCLLTVLALSGCSAEDAKHVAVLFMPEPATTEGHYIADLWDWMWLAAWVTGLVMWGLMAWVSIRYRRRDESHIPVQMRYHLPIEIFYTVLPVLMVVVIFFHTVKVQDALAADDDAPADHTIQVTGQKWSWTFNYEVEVADDEERTVSADSSNTVYDVGTPANPPTLYLPVDEHIRFELRSPDVIHDFWVPGFLYKMDVVPGRANGFALTPNREGTFDGKCAELCGTYHSRMLFNVKVVPRAEYDARLKQLAAEGNTGLAPGSVFHTEQAGLESANEGGQE